MHGLIFAELQKYVNARRGAAGWLRLLQDAGLPNKVYVPASIYPDEEARALVSAGAALAGHDEDDFLQDFGEFIAPDLLRMYASLIPKEWSTLDVLEHTEPTIHRVVRAQNPGAAPPRLRCHRVRPSEVVITYASERRLCAVAKGIAKGIAAERKERVAIEETRCMLRGEPACEIHVSLLSEATDEAL